MLSVRQSHGWVSMCQFGNRKKPFADDPRKALWRAAEEFCRWKVAGDRSVALLGLVPHGTREMSGSGRDGLAVVTTASVGMLAARLYVLRGTCTAVS